MAIYIIKDSQGNEVNRIKGSAEFVAKHYEHYERYQEPQPTAEELTAQAKQEARDWRNQELDRTDKFMSVSDYPHTTAMQTYRQALRDWTDSETFPDTKPVFEVTPDE